MAKGAGYGHGKYGVGPYGKTDWCFHVLYTELPPRLQEQDANSGGYYEKFVKALSVPFNRMHTLVNNFSSLMDPLNIRLDLLRYYAASFGLEIDTAEANTFQRSAADIHARFLLIKGRKQSFIVLARVHGFDCTVEELWWNGTEFSSTQTPKTGESVGVIP